MSYQPATPVTAPPVVTWFKVYAGFMAFMYFAVLALGIGIAIVQPGEDAAEAVFSGVLLAGVGIVLLALFLGGLLLRPAPWVWTYDIVLICIGMTSCLTLPACIPLLIFWFKPETKRYFGRA